MAVKTLPLGIDMGSTRIRVVAAVADRSGIRITAVAVREIAAGRCTSGAIEEPAYVAAVIEDAIVELHVRQRRCVCAIGAPDALLREMRFPKMSARERSRSAHFEAQRHVDYPLAEAVVRVAPAGSGPGIWSVGIARNRSIRTRVAALKDAGLKPMAMDHEAYALARALPHFEGIVDIGHGRASLHVRRAGTPVTYQTRTGGEQITRGIERALCIDQHSAEKRKRIVGTAGAGEEARAELCTEIARLINEAQADRPLRTVAVVGNGGRLPGMATQLEVLTGVRCEFPVCDVLREGPYPEEVLRSSAPDWTLGAGLAMWGRA